MMDTSTSEAQPMKRKRRRIQFGMRTLMVALFLGCLAFGWLSRLLQEARERDAIVFQLDQAGVYIYQYEPTALGRLTRTSRSFDYWIRTRLGDSLLSTPSAINAHRMGDAEAEYLIRQRRHFPRLRILHLGSLRKENEDRLRTAFPHVELQAPGFGLQGSVGLLQPNEP